MRTGSCPTKDGVLELCSRGITSVPANAFEGLSKTKVLILYDNKLSALPAGIFAGLSNLQTLLLYDNKLSALSDGVFAGLSSLRELHLVGFSALPDGIFAGLSLERLVLDRTLQCAPLSAQQRSQLLTGHIAYEGPFTCTSIPWTVAFGNCTFSGNFKGAPLVRTGVCPGFSGGLNLAARAITSVQPDAFAGLQKMTWLSLSGNQLSDLPTDNFPGDHYSLQSLNFSNNNFSALSHDIFDRLYGITRLDLSSNKLSALPHIPRSLEYLDLSNNLFSALPADSFQIKNGPPSSSLRYLYLYNNLLSALPAGIFTGLSKIEKLYLTNNQLPALPPFIFAGLADLRELHLASNQFSALPAGTFLGLSSLEELLFSNNQFSTLPAGIFDGLSKLTTLDLTLNPWSALPAGVFDGLSSLRVLNIQETADSGGNYQLVCVPLTAEKRAAIPMYRGTPTLCPCEAGFYGNPSACTPCAAGKFLTTTTRTDTCQVCDAGKYAVDGQAACRECPAGKYGELKGGSAETSCTACGTGKYGIDTGQSSCLTCPPYSNSPPGSTSLTTCTCNAGSTGPNGGPCSQCAAGKVKAEPGPAACTLTSTGNTDATHVVKVTLSLPMREADFTSDKQTLFKKSLAAAAGEGVFETDVTIDKIEPINGGRRLLAESIRVGTIIKASNLAAADTMTNALTQDKINAALSKSGLPAATLLEVSAGTVSGGATPEKESFGDKVKSEGLGAIIGGAVGGFFTLVGMLVAYFRSWISSKCGFSGESDQNQEPVAQAEQKATAEASIVTSDVTMEVSAAASTGALTGKD